MKRLKFLAIYTAVIIVVSFLFRNMTNFASMLYFITGMVLLLIAGLLFGSMTNQSFKVFTNFDELERKSKGSKKDISFISIFTYLYLIVPFIIAIALFAN